MIIGILLQQMILQFHKKINNNPADTPFGLNLIFLLIARPTFVVGFALFIMPIVLGNPFTRPLKRILAHEYWLYQSRLVFGVFLCNTVYMQYYVFNLEHGLWLQKFDSILLCFSFLTISFIFSFCLYLVIDGPTSLLVSQFIKLDADISDCVISQEAVSEGDSTHETSAVNTAVN